MAATARRVRLGLCCAAVALTAVRPVAAQTPTEMPAVRLAPVHGRPHGADGTLPVTRLADPGVAADLDAVAVGAVTFSQPLPIRDVVSLLFRGTGYSVVFHPAVAGTFSGDLAQVSLKQALEAVLAPHGLTYTTNGPVVQVLPHRTETRLFEVNQPNVVRSWERQAGGGAGAAGSNSRLTTRSDADFHGQLRLAINAMLSPDGRAHVDPQAGLVYVTDYPERLEQIGSYIETATLRAARQVRLSARVLAVTLRAPHGAIDWSRVSREAGWQAGDRTGVLLKDPEGLAAALARFGEVVTIAAPDIVALNNQPTVIRISPSGRSDAGPHAGGAMGRLAGLELAVTAQVAADRTVGLSVSPSYAGSPGLAGGSAMAVDVDTVMRVKDGETLILSGLIADAHRPVAAGGLARVFGGRSKEAIRHELVVLVTPTIVTAGAPPAAGAR